MCVCTEAGRGPKGGWKVGLARPCGAVLQEAGGVVSWGCVPQGGLCLPKYDCSVVSREPGEGRLL